MYQTFAGSARLRNRGSLAVCSAGPVSDRTRQVPAQRLSRQDAAILELESPTIAGHTCKVAIVEPLPGAERPTVERLRNRISAQLAFEPRLRCRLEPTPLGLAPPLWVEDRSFDVANHIRAMKTNSPVSRAHFHELVATAMTQRLDRARPLWQLDLVDELEDGSCGLIWRLHHCMVDGVGALELGSVLLWDGAPDAVVGPDGSVQGDADLGSAELLARGLAYRARGAAGAAAGLARAFSPRRWTAVRGNAARVRTTVRRELWPTARPSPLDHRAGPTRTVAFASGPLADFKQIGHALGPGITVNDGVLAVVAGAVRTWLERRDAGEAGVRVKVPVSLHHHDEQADELGNRDSYFFVDLPVGEPDPVLRLRAISRETSERKRDRDAEMLAGLPPHRALSRWAMSPHVFTFNVSNVPGPADPLLLFGAPVRELYSLAEIAEHHAFRVAVISAAGTLFFGLCADADVVSDIDLLAEGIERSLAELRERAGI
jgi:WS/DGAT/MGAT family acyltransferase